MCFAHKDSQLEACEASSHHRSCSTGILADHMTTTFLIHCYYNHLEVTHLLVLGLKYPQWKQICSFKVTRRLIGPHAMDYSDARTPKDPRDMQGL